MVGAVFHSARALRKISSISLRIAGIRWTELVIPPFCSAFFSFASRLFKRSRIWLRVSCNAPKSAPRICLFLSCSSYSFLPQSRWICKRLPIIVESMTFIVHPRYILFGILFFAFFVRIAGVGYGLPLWLFDDEPSLVTSALKMLEAKTLVPRFHQEEFGGLLYYPPYLSYLYLVPFSVIIGIEYLLFYGDWTQFINYLLVDASSFFITARLMSITFGMLTVGLLYTAAKQIFYSEKIALLSAFFLAFSVTHTNLSSFAIHWIPATFFFTLGLWAVTCRRLSFRIKYILSAAVAGIGFGFSIMSVFVLLLVPLTYIFVEKKTMFSALKEKTLYQAAAIFLALAAVPMMLNPNSFGFVSDTTLAGNAKTLISALTSPVGFLKPIAFTEPILVVFAVLGLVMLFVNKRHRGYCFVIIAFVVFYAVIFYLGFRFEERFMLPLIPILSLAAGYGGASILNYAAKNKLALAVILIILLIPIAASIKLAWLKYHDDNRIQARQWIEKHIKQNAKIAVYANLTRVASTPNAISEQENIDRSSLRRVDKAEREFTQNPHRIPSFHALNLYSVSNENFFSSLDAYLQKGGYKYILISAKPNENLPYYKTFGSAIAHATLVKTFGETQNIENFTNGSIGSVIQLFKAKHVGVSVVLYALQ